MRATGRLSNALVAAIAFLAIVSMTLGATAQEPGNATNVGYPEYGIFHGTDIESVQISNGNLHVQIPVWSAKGRGLGTAGMYVYDSKGWYFKHTCYSSGICVDLVDVQPASNIMLTAHGPLDYVISQKGFTYQCGATLYAHGKGYTLVEPNGTKHHFLPDPVSATTQCGGVTTVASTLYADDGSGWTMQLDGSSNPTATIRKDGTALTARLEDSNGNYITSGTDTLGRTIYGGATYVDSSGKTRTAAVTSTTSVTVATQLCGLSEADQCTEHSATWTLPQVITLPDNATYSFAYAQNAGAEITSITLPTGGTISYTWGAWYPGGRVVATRTVTSSGTTGTWKYTIKGTGVTMTDPEQNDTTYDCSAASDNSYPYITPCFPSVTKYYSGSSTIASPILLKTEQVDYQAYVLGPTNINNVIKVPIRTTTTWNQMNQVMKTETDWDTAAVTGGTTTWKNPIEIREYDWGSGAPGPLLRRTDYAYLHLSNPSYLTANIANRPTSKIIYDGSGTQFARTLYAYDQTAVASAAGAPGHDDTTFGTGNNIRGNLTTLSQWRNTDGALLNTTYTYDMLGNRLSEVDPLGHPTSYDYTDNATGACVPSSNTHAYVTTITDALGFRTMHSYLYCNGLPKWTKDENDIRALRQGTVITRDLMDRPLTITYSDGGQTSFAYSDSPAPMTITATTWINHLLSPQVDKTVVTELDGMGRLRKTTLTSDRDGATYSRTSFDAFGRKYQIWDATHCDPDTYTSCSGESTFGKVTYKYDALGRQILFIPQDGSSTANNVTTSYSGNTTTTVDEAGVSRTVTQDALNRAAVVSEDNPGWITKYTYDPLGDLTCVEQHGGVTGTGCSAAISSDATSPWRIRRFTYDSLSHLLAAKNPEAGTSTSTCNGGTNPWSICYTYNNDGMLTGRTDARGVLTNYSPSGSPLDALHRVTQKTYSNGDPSVTYTYDSTAVANGIHHRTGMSDASGSTTWSYDSEDRVTNESRIIAGVSKSISTVYNLDGSLWKITDPGSVVVEYVPGGTGRPIAVIDDTNTIYYGGAAIYAPQGTLSSLLLGWTGPFAGITETETYNKRLQPLHLLAKSPTKTLLNLTYGFNLQVADNGNVFSITNGRDSSRSQTFTYDGANRIYSATGGTRWGISFTNSVDGSPGIDAWGNLIQTSQVSGTSTFPMSVNQQAGVNNRFTLLGYGYDGAGNVIDDGSNNTACSGHAYSWNAEGEMKCALGTTYVYDGDGRRVKKSGGSSVATLYWGGDVGDAIAESDLSGNITSDYIFFDGKRIARRDVSSNTPYYMFTDMLGSTNVVSDAQGTTILNDSDFLPYGGEVQYVQALPNQHYKFTGKERDSETGNDYFGARYFMNTSGRWLSPDWSAKEEPVPYASFANPQSLNLYSYVLNNPESAPDLDGHVFAGAFNGGKHGCDGIGLCDDNAPGVQAVGKGDQNVVQGAQQQNNTTGYATQDAAARGALTNANPASIKANREYGGLIYSDKDGKYHYSGPVIGGDQGVNPHDAGHPDGTTVVGDYHTHGDYSVAGPHGEAIRTSDPKRDDFNSDHFSVGPHADTGGIIHDAAGNPNYRGYLGTPSGNFLIFNPVTGKESPLP